MTTMGRRQVVGLGALGLGAVAIEGCGVGMPWSNAPTMRADEVDRLLAELDHVVAQLQTIEPHPEAFGIKRNDPTVPSAHATCIRLLTTLCFMGTYRDVPEDHWSEPRVEERLAATLPKINTMIRAARQQLTSLSAEEGERIDKKLSDDPKLTMRIMERIDEYAREIHVPVEQRMYLRTATAQLSSRFQYEGSNEVMKNLAAKWDRSLATKMNALGMQVSEQPTTDVVDEHKPERAPLRVKFRTNATSHDVRTAACSLEPKMTLDGKERQIVLDWDEVRCATTRKLDDVPVIRASVHMEPVSGDQSDVTVALYPPSDAIDEEALTRAVTSLTERVRSVLAATAQPPTQVQARLGEAGESCRAKPDCESALECVRGECKEEELASSARLMKTTRKVAKWGAILLIPPICAIGALVLLVALFMVIVAGCMYAAGD